MTETSLDRKIAASRARAEAEARARPLGTRIDPESFARDNFLPDGTVTPAPAEPPLGATPRSVANVRRLEELDGAISRYQAAGVTPLAEWIREAEWLRLGGDMANPGIVPKIEAPEAMAALMHALHADPDYAHTWLCNLADAIQEVEEWDEPMSDHEVANRAAALILERAFGLDPLKLLAKVGYSTRQPATWGDKETQAYPNESATEMIRRISSAYPVQFKSLHKPVAPPSSQQLWDDLIRPGPYSGLMPKHASVNLTAGSSGAAGNMALRGRIHRAITDKYREALEPGPVEFKTIGYIADPKEFTRLQDVLDQAHAQIQANAGVLLRSIPGPKAKIDARKLRNEGAHAPLPGNWEEALAELREVSAANLPMGREYLFRVQELCGLHGWQRLAQEYSRPSDGTRKKHEVLGIWITEAMRIWVTINDQA